MPTSPSKQPRKFEYVPAARKAVPLLIGLNGPSGCGKTYSALRLATGIQRVTGGEIACIDTEANRMLHYADRFKFNHIPFTPPFSPSDYLEAIEFAVSKGARILVIDSASHLHDGPGGVLEMHADEVERLGGPQHNFPAWAKPKADLRRFINAVTVGIGNTSNPLNLIFCFRAKSKMKIEGGRGSKPEHQGFVPIASEEFIFEMTTNILLYPGSKGEPTWKSNMPGERETIKLPDQFSSMFGARSQLDEDAGEKMARWATGGDAPVVTVNPKVAQTTKAWLDWAAKKGVNAEQVLAKLGKASVDHVDTRDHETLAQLQGRVKAGEISIASAFAVSTPAPDDDEPAEDDRGDEPTPEEMAAAAAVQGKTNGSAAAPRGEG
jgi:hypothetical protein